MQGTLKQAVLNYQSMQCEMHRNRIIKRETMELDVRINVPASFELTRG